jgi:hypothetical protein
MVTTVLFYLQHGLRQLLPLAKHLNPPARTRNPLVGWCSSTVARPCAEQPDTQAPVTS